MSGTKLPISDKPLEAWGSIFNGIDLSTKTIDAFHYMREEYEHFGSCDLTNCGVHINLHVDDFIDGKYKEDLQQAMDTDWVGCYVNGKKVLSHEEKKANAKEKKSEYERMKEEIINSTMESINDQISDFKR